MMKALADTPSSPMTVEPHRSIAGSPTSARNKPPSSRQALSPQRNARSMTLSRYRTSPVVRTPRATSRPITTIAVPVRASLSWSRPRRNRRDRRSCGPKPRPDYPALLIWTGTGGHRMLYTSPRSRLEDALSTAFAARWSPKTPLPFLLQT